MSFRGPLVHQTLAEGAGTANGEVGSALGALEPLVFNSLVLVLDRHFVHRLRIRLTASDFDRLSSAFLAELERRFL